MKIENMFVTYGRGLALPPIRNKHVFIFMYVIRIPNRLVSAMRALAPSLKLNSLLALDRKLEASCTANKEIRNSLRT
jgi:hypothetical protein